MARGVNKVIIVGNLGSDPEIKYMPSGDAVCNVSVATTESWNDKKSGEKKTTLATEGAGSPSGSPVASGRPSALKKADPLESISIISMKSSRNKQQQE